MVAEVVVLEIVVVEVRVVEVVVFDAVEDDVVVSDVEVAVLVLELVVVKVVLVCVADVVVLDILDVVWEELVDAEADDDVEELEVAFVKFVAVVVLVSVVVEVDVSVVPVSVTLVVVSVNVVLVSKQSSANSWFMSRASPKTTPGGSIGWHFCNIAKLVGNNHRLGSRSSQTIEKFCPRFGAMVRHAQTRVTLAM